MKIKTLGTPWITQIPYLAVIFRVSVGTRDQHIRGYIVMVRVRCTIKQEDISNYMVFYSRIVISLIGIFRDRVDVSS